MKVRLTSLSEATRYNEITEKEQKALTTAIHKPLSPPEYYVIARLSPAAMTGDGYIEMSVPLEQLPAGAQIGDEFELYFERAKKEKN